MANSIAFEQATQPGAYGNVQLSNGPAPGTLGFDTSAAPAAGGSSQGGAGFLGDFGDSFMGHAAYAPGGQFGSNPVTDTYANQASQLGLNQAGYDQGIGNQNAMSLYGQASVGQGRLQNFGNQYAGRFNALGQQFGQQRAPTVNMTGANIAAANQANALGMYGAAAAGNGPSAAQAQLQAGLQQSIQAQQAEAASARGGFGLANAQHDAMVNSGQLAGNAANASAQLRAQEQQAGMAGYAGLASTAQAQQAQNALNLAQLQQAQNQYNAQNQLAAYGASAGNALAFNNAGMNYGLNAQQLGLGNQLAYSQLGQGNQLAYNQLGQTALQAQLNADVSNQQAANQQMAGNAQRQQQGAGGILSALGSLF